MRPFLVSLTILLGVGLPCFAAAPPPAHADDQLDFLFLASDRPVLIRMHVRMGDRPYDATWVVFMDKLFDWFDKDKDGTLSPAEVARLPSGASLANQTQGGIQGNDAKGVPFAAIDADKDGKVTRREFRAFYRHGGFPGYKVYSPPHYVTIANQLTASLYRHLDPAQEKSLTADKVAGMYRKLRALDVDDDEILSASKVNNGIVPGNSEGVLISEKFRSATVVEPGLLQVLPGQEASLVKQLMDRYDRNKDGKLSRAEAGLPAAAFAALDADRDGTLGAAELRAYLATPPDLILRLQVGPTGVAANRGVLGRLGFASVLTGPKPRLIVANEKTLSGPMTKARRTGPNDLAFELGDTRMAIQAKAVRPSDTSARAYNAKNWYGLEFDRIAGNKPFIQRSDEKAHPKAHVLRIFPQADRDGDGRLTRSELFAWLDFVEAGQDANITIAVFDNGRSQFRFLDADDDNRLSLREMKNAWERLKPFAKDGKVTRADLPRTFSVVVGQGGLADRLPSRRNTPPAWFRKMDRNNDGDVSPREWLGTDEEFKAIDTDGDGLISVAEAIAFEAKKKKTR